MLISQGERKGEIVVGTLGEGEFDEFLHKAKNQEAPGTDEMPIEFYKWPNATARKEVLVIIRDLCDATAATLISLSELAGEV